MSLHVLIFLEACARFFYVNNDIERNKKMSFNSIDYLIFFPIVVLLYFVLPKKLRMYWLLFASYYFYMSWNIKYGLLILFSTAVTYICGVALEWVKKHYSDYKQKKLKLLVVFLSLIINLGLLFYFKYTNFAIGSINILFMHMGISIQYPLFDSVLPIGISFFIFQAIG